MAAKDDLIKAIVKAAKIKAEEFTDLLEVPADPKLGDFALPCFKLSKHFKRNPNLIAEDLVKAIDLPESIQRAEAKGPYINFFVNNSLLMKELVETILKEKEKFGSLKSNKKTFLVESPGPNTNKPLHLGHIRNLFLGDSIARIYSKLGYNVKRINIINDRGIHVCKSMLAYQKWGNNKEPVNEKSDHFVGDFYVMFARNAADEPKFEEEAQEMLRKWEAGDKEVLAIWEKMNKWCIDGHKQTYKSLDFKHDKEYLESKTYKKGKEIVLEGLKKNLFYKTADGAVAINLGKELGEKILIRKDGTSLYITQDLYLAEKRFEDFKFDKLVYVVGNEQEYHFKVLFELFKLLKKPFADKCYHLSYGMVNLESGKMKSREGTVIDADDLIQETKDLAKVEVEARNPSMTEHEKEALVKAIGLSAIKFAFLKFDAKKDFVFKPGESVKFDGTTGPYLQYSLVRAKKIQQKVDKKVSKPDFKLLTDPAEIKLAKKLALFPETVENTAKAYSPHILANYSYELSQTFNEFYESVSVANAGTPAIQNARLALVQAFEIIIGNCLDLLGIEKVNQM